MEMCRFAGSHDGEFQKVADAFKSVRDELPERQHALALSGPSAFSTSHINVSEAESSVKQPTYAHETLLKSLWSDKMDYRYTSIKPKLAKTCEWVLCRNDYQDWLKFRNRETHHGIFWLKGKPGSGKSTLMKFLLKNAPKAEGPAVTAYFFFNARGTEIEKSTLGMYRSLLFQILTAIPEARQVLSTLPPASDLDDDRRWSEEDLQDVFRLVVENLGRRRLTCFIDALDECDEYQIRAMISWLERLGECATSSRAQFQVCLSSRHYPHVFIERSIEVILEDQPEHDHDIKKYVDAELRAGRGKKIEDIKRAIEAKSGGVFLWVVLVIPILKKAFDAGQVHALEERLKSIPKGLDELFEDILQRDEDDIDDFILCLQWLLYAFRQLNRQEMYYALRAGIGPGTLADTTGEEVSVEVMDKYILSRSKGFAEVTKTKATTVQFIHESVSGFFKARSNAGHLQLKLEHGISNDRLKDCCAKYMAAAVTQDATGTYHKTKNGILKRGIGVSTSRNSDAAAARDSRNSLQTSYPLLRYADQYIFEHAEAAERSGNSQWTFLKTFDGRAWTELHNILEQYPIRKYWDDFELIYVLADKQLPWLVRLAMQIHPDLNPYEESKQRYGSPVGAAMASSQGEKETIHALVGPVIKFGSISGKLSIRLIQHDASGRVCP